MQDKRQLILRSAEQIIATRGIQGLSMQQIASEADVAVGSIYRYFKDKNELILELRKDVLIQVAEYVLQDSQLGTLEERFKRIWFKMHEFGKQRSPTNLSYEQYAHLPDADTEAIKSFELKTFQPLHLLFEEGKATGVLQPLHSRALYALSLEPAMTLARTIRRGQINYHPQELALACNLCWQTILISPESTK